MNKSILLLLIIAILFSVYCSKEKEKCGKITNVTIKTVISKKDTVGITFKVQFTPTDIRDFYITRNEKKHPPQYWYDYIGREHCIGAKYPD